MKFTLLVAALGVAASGFAIADTYQAEVSGVANRFDWASHLSNPDEKSYGLMGNYYFNAVKTDNLPLAEAAYLGKNSNVFATVFDYPRQNGDSSAQKYQAGAEFYIPENFLYVKAGVSRYSTDNYRKNDWFTAIGITPIDGLLVTTEYSHEDGYDANIHAKYVAELGGHFINLEAGVTDTYAGTGTEVGGDFYIDNTFSVGGLIRDDHYDGDSYTLRTRKFFSESFSGDLSYTDSDFGNILKVGLSFRF